MGGTDVKTKDAGHCDRFFRYSLSGEGEDLRFEDFELTGPLKGSELEESLRSYFVGRPLSRVSATDIPPTCCTEDEDCRDHILQHVLEVKRMLRR